MLSADSRQQLQEIQNIGGSDSYPREERIELLEEAQEVAKKAAEYDGGDGYEEFLAEYIREAKRDDTDRELCSCRLFNCPLKRGEIPPQLRQRGSGMLHNRPTEELVKEYLKDHPAEIVAEAHREWQQRQTELEAKVSELYGRKEKLREMHGDELTA